MFVAILRKLSSYSWYQNIKDLKIQTFGRYEYEKWDKIGRKPRDKSSKEDNTSWHGSEEDGKQSDSNSSESIRPRPRWGSRINRRIESSEGIQSDDPLDTAARNTLLNDVFDIDSTDGDNTPPRLYGMWDINYGKYLMHCISEAGEIEYYPKLISTLTDAEKEFIGPFLSYDDTKAILTEELRYPNYLEILDILHYRTDMDLSDEREPKHPLFYFFPTPFSAIDHLKIRINTIKPTPEESLVLERDLPTTPLFVFENIKRLTLRLGHPSDSAGLEYYSHRFPNVEELELYMIYSDEGCGINNLGAAPALKRLTLQWPSYNYQNMSPERIEKIFIRPVLDTTTLLQSLQTVIFNGRRIHKDEEEKISVTCVITPSPDFDDRKDAKITWLGVKEESGYLNIYESGDELWEEDSEDEFMENVRNYAMGRWNHGMLAESSDEEEEDEEEDDDSEDERRYRFVPAANEYTVIRPLADSSDEEGYEEESEQDDVVVNRYQYGSDDEEGYTQDEDQDEEEMGEGEEEEEGVEGEEFQVNCDNPYRTTLADRSPEFGYATQESVYDTLAGGMGQSTQEKKSQDKVNSGGGGMDEKAKEALRIRNLYRR
ncbi:hypothetical protein AA313_de0204956 [Arthrobotrys entomopaga]|nr:hypothetical protein AA313_de0204956 [Arthrobotrys entomopaga]